ncbi:MAG TPA: glycosyltransferase [Anaeromyxobacteraceae bacterium]|nr:glycosyltransferase [Anaeromyxobacteraceae bacterium]
MTVDVVSIVIPNYNYERYVRDAITSALGQTHRNVEIVVVDDGSTDGSVATIRTMPAFADGAFRLLVQANAGVARARNAGAAISAGSFLVFLDADDVLEPTYVERCLGALRSAPPSVAYAYTQMQRFGAETSLFASRPFDAAALIRSNFVPVSAMIRRRAFEDVGAFNPRLGHEDHELWVRMLAHGYQGVFVPEPLLRYRRHPGPSRNTLSPAQLVRMRFDMAIRHPTLYWRELVASPRHALLAAARMLRAGRAGSGARGAARREAS